MTTSIQGQPTTGANGAPRQGEQLQQAATGLLDQAARTADAQASTRMTLMGETIDGVAQAVQDMAGQLREQQPEIANFVETGASRLDEVATYLRDHTASEALQNLQEVARRQPALIVGGGLVAGLLIGRFLRTGASVAQGSMQGGASQYGRGGYGARDYGAGSSAEGSSAEGSFGGTGYGSDAYAPGGTAVAATEYGKSDLANELAATDVAADASLEEVDEVDVVVEDTGDLGQPEATAGGTRGGGR